MNKQGLLIVATWCVATLLSESASAQVGRHFPSEKKVIADPVTGAPLTFLTTRPSNDQKLYQTHQPWTADGKWIIFRSSDRVEGRAGQAFAVNEETGVIVQLTEGPVSSTSALNVARKSMKLYYSRSTGGGRGGAGAPGGRQVQIFELDLARLFADSEAGGYLLAYAMPLKKIYLTGKRPGVAPQLDAAAAQALILDGRGWSNKDRNSAYDKLSGDQLFERLGSWSPVVRERAAMALARRKDTPIPRLPKMLESPALNSRYGACQALIALRKRGAPAVDSLRKALAGKDLWLRIKAAEALASIATPAAQTVPELLELLAQVDMENDPRGMQQRYLCFALFDDGGVLSRSLDGVDREPLYKAVRAGLKNQDGRARGSIGSVYRNLSFEEIKPLLPAIYQAIIEPAPSGEMFADSIRVEGLRLLAKHRIEEGIRACVNYTRDQNPWDSQERTPELMKILLGYGAHAKSVIPELTRIADYFEKDEKDFPKELMLMKAKCVRETIRAIEASTESPELNRLK